MEANIEELKMQVANLIARVSMAEAQIAEMDDDIPEIKDVVVGDDFTATTSEYASYFKVVDASTEGNCLIGVVDGGWIGGVSPENCGAVKINGYYVELEYFVSEEAISLDGTYWVWLQSYLLGTGTPNAEIIVGAYNASTPPAGHDGCIAYANQLLGRARVVDLKIVEITQDYLRGGEHIEYLWAPCLEENQA